MIYLMIDHPSVVVVTVDHDDDYQRNVKRERSEAARRNRSNVKRSDCFVFVHVVNAVAFRVVVVEVSSRTTGRTATTTAAATAAME
jgi:hypothetical protein